MEKKKLLKLLIKLEKDYPLIPHTNAGRLFSTVRRMKAEKELNIPINLRNGFVISPITGLAANQMYNNEWEKFYKKLSNKLRREYPNLYKQIFSI